jgi:hypothetical protein
VDATARCCAAWCDAFGWTTGHVTQHKLLTARKSDTSFPGNWWERIDGHRAPRRDASLPDLGFADPYESEGCADGDDHPESEG